MFQTNMYRFFGRNVNHLHFQYKSQKSESQRISRAIEQIITKRKNDLLKATNISYICVCVCVCVCVRACFSAKVNWQCMA